METTRDFYDVLGVARGADEATIKRAFRAKARLLHPDVSADPDAERKFRELAEAYAVLSRSASRMLYDRFGYRGRAWAAEPASAHAFARLMDFWRATRRTHAAGAVGYIDLGFYEAMRGGRRLVRYTSRSESAEPCGSCSGRGTVRRTVDSGDVVLLQLVTCDACEGSGRLGGAKEEDREVLVSIPAGAEDGEQIPIEGDPGAFAVLRVGPRPPDSTLVRAVAAAGLLVALAFLIFLFLG